MSLEIEYERPHERNEPEILQIIIIKYIRYNDKSMYPEKEIHSLIDEHVKKFVPYSGECEYQIDYTFKNRDKPRGVAAVYDPP